jgi:GNAT superfamily N-acetyltransferase
MENIIYRTYKKGDERQLADLFNKSFQMNGASFIRTSKSWNWRYAQSPSFEPEMIQIAEEGNIKKIIGAVYVNLVEHVNFKGEKFLKGEINDVSCLPEYTRKGIAKNLMIKAIDYMKRKDCDLSMLTADFHGFPRKKIYLKCGFEDLDRELVFVWFPRIFQLMNEFPLFWMLYPIVIPFSYIPKLIYRVFMKKRPHISSLSYEIVRNEKHFQYMRALNRIMSKYYEGFYPYSETKYSWARINVPTKKDQPTYVIVRKNGVIIGGAEFSCTNIHSFKFKFKFKIGIVHEIFLDKSAFNSIIDIQNGYSYLIDKLLIAAFRRSVGVLILFISSFENDLYYALRRTNLINFKGASIMIKKLKSEIQIGKLAKPLYIPTHISFSLP